jgi:hypothetical protein
VAAAGDYAAGARPHGGRNIKGHEVCSAISVFDPECTLTAGAAVTRERFRLAAHSNLARAIIRAVAIVGAGRNDHPVAAQQFAEARRLGHGIVLQLSAAACRREW